MNLVQIKKGAALLLSMSMLSLSACKNNNVSNKILGGADVGALVSGGESSGDSATLSSLVSGVSSTNGTTTAATGSIPTGTTAALACTTTGNTNVINGGSAQLSVRAPTGQNYSRCNVSVQSASLAAPAAGATVAVSGYWHVVFTDMQNTRAVNIQISQTLAATSFICIITLEDSSGNIGAPTTVTFTRATTTNVGTGDVQVSLSWDTVADIDLHVVDPSGAEVYYGNRTVASGGTLDLDANVPCTGISNENVTWPTGTAPAGTYIVRVANFDECSASATNCVITVNVAGITRTFNQTFTGAGTGGGAAAGTAICQFTKTGVFSAPRVNTVRSIGVKTGACAQ